MSRPVGWKCDRCGVVEEPNGAWLTVDVRSSDHKQTYDFCPKCRPAISVFLDRKKEGGR